MKPSRRVLLRFALYGTGAAAAYALIRWPGTVAHALAVVQGKRRRTVADVVAEHGVRIEQLVRPILGSWPPTSLDVLAFKRERRLEVWCGDARGDKTRVGAVPILAASGELGPKREEGDNQVPEGVYALAVLNPESTFHLSMRVDYPNADDIARSRVPLSAIGGDIYVHGNNASIGCIAIGNAAIEEVFTLAALVPAEKRRIVISPIDFRRDAVVDDLPDEQALYAKLRAALAAYPI